MWKISGLTWSSIMVFPPSFIRKINSVTDIFRITREIQWETRDCKERWKLVVEEQENRSPLVDVCITQQVSSLIFVTPRDARLMQIAARVISRNNSKQPSRYVWGRNQTTARCINLIGHVDRTAVYLLFITNKLFDVIVSQRIIIGISITKTSHSSCH
jgi:hypothetical protein